MAKFRVLPKCVILRMSIVIVLDNGHVKFAPDTGCRGIHFIDTSVSTQSL